MIGLSFLVLLLLGAWRRIALAGNRLDLALHLGAVAACCALLAHSLVDFNLHIPANALIFLTLAALATCPTAKIPESPYSTHAKQASKLNVTRTVSTV